MYSFSTIKNKIYVYIYIATILPQAGNQLAPASGQVGWLSENFWDHFWQTYKNIMMPAFFIECRPSRY